MNLRQAVSKTLSYGDYFDFPLTHEEACLWLISSHYATKQSIEKYIVPLDPRELKKKQILFKNTQKKVKLALNLVKYAQLFPSIRLIALTGSVAANNAKIGDDVDLFIITAPHTLWITRPLFLLFLSLRFNRRHPGDKPSSSANAFCPNLWLDTRSLCLSKNKRNLYSAHEVLQIKPIFDRGQTHQKFIMANSWAKNYLANAYRKFSQESVSNDSVSVLSIMAAPLNLILFILQYLYMLPKKTTETVTLHSAFFHKNNLSPSLTRYIKSKSL